MSLVIRPAAPADIPAVADLLRASAVDQGSASSLVVDVESLLRDGFGEQPRFYLLVAESDGGLAGVALYFFNYSTWISTRGLYLEDLYVAPAFRRRGVARELMRRLARVAREEGCGRFQWSVLLSNQSAIRFYESIGAHLAQEWTWMGMYGEEIDRLAGE